MLGSKLNHFSKRGHWGAPTPAVHQVVCWSCRWLVCTVRTPAVLHRRWRATAGCRRTLYPAMISVVGRPDACCNDPTWTRLLTTKEDFWVIWCDIRKLQHVSIILTHWPKVTHTRVSKLGHHFFHIMACCLNSVKPLYEPMFIYC